MAEAGQLIVLVRHGQTAWTREGKHTGWTDIPLDQAGRDEANQLAIRLRSWRFQKVLTSPLQRAMETCRLAGVMGEPRDDLREWNYGSYEGRTSTEIQAERPGWDLWRDGCPGGETAEQVGARADRVLAELRTVAGNSAVFAHGHLLRVLGARWLGLRAESGALFALTTAAISILGYEHDRAVFQRWNDVGS